MQDRIHICEVKDMNTERIQTTHFRAHTSPDADRFATLDLRLTDGTPGLIGYAETHEGMEELIDTCIRELAALRADVGKLRLP